MIRIGLVTLAAVLALALLPMMGSSREDTREIRVVARGMTFYIDGVAGPNPTLRLHPGDRVRLILRNEDAGMRHDFTIGSWDVATGPLDARREAAVSFRVPEARGDISYFCTPHRATMRGTIRIE